MRSRNKKIIAVALSAALTVCVLSSQRVQANYTGTESYMSGKYYRQLQQVKLTGDPRTDIVAIAKSQVGYQEGNSADQLTGEVYGSKNFTEYGDWYGVQDMWCAMFASWCAKEAGISTETIPSHCATPEGLNWFTGRGLTYSREEVQDRKYTPKPGDLVYFKTSRNAKPTNHVGIVTAYSNGRVYTVEGNVGAVNTTTGGGMVVEKSYPITNTFIVYFCSPAYESGSTNVLLEVQEEEVARQSLRQALFAVETGDDLAYDAVHVDGFGGVSLGCGQWYGAQAIRLLSQINREDPQAYARFDPEGKLLQEGNLSRLTVKQIHSLQQLLCSESGVRVQNDWMDRCLIQWTQQATTLGVTDDDALLLCAALYQLRGETTAEALIQKAGKNPDGETLLNVIKACEPGLYRTCCLLIT